MLLNTIVITGLISILILFFYWILHSRKNLKAKLDKLPVTTGNTKTSAGEQKQVNSNTTPGLEELKSIFRRTYHDGRIFSSEIKSVGYHMTEETPWGSVIMERGEDKFIISIHSGGISSLIYRNEIQNLSVDLVVEGKMTF
jgi:hypothetical protein